MKIRNIKNISVPATTDIFFLFTVIIIFTASTAHATGIIVSTGTTRTNECFQDIGYTKVKLLRLDVTWVEIEPEKGTFSWVNRLNKAIDYGTQFGFEVVPLIRTGMCWANGYSTPPERQFPSEPPSDLSTEWDEDYGFSQNYYTFISTLISHYRYQIHNIIIENEANVEGMWSGSAQDYIKLLATAYKAAHDTNPDINVFPDGTASCTWGLLIARQMLDSGEYSPQEIFDFVQGYFEKRTDISFSTPEELIDYLENNPGFLRQKDFVDYELTHLDGIQDGFNFHFSESFWYLNFVTAYFTGIFDDSGVKIKTIILDELAERDPDGVFTEHDENEYAGLLIKKMSEAYHLNCSQVYWFPFNEKGLEHLKFGILDGEGNRRTATESFRFLCSVLDSTYYSPERDTLNGGTIIRTGFVNSKSLQKDFVILWWDNGSHGEGSDTVTIDFPDFANSVNCYDFSGNHLDVEPEGRCIELIVSELPVFILWNSSSVNDSDNQSESLSTNNAIIESCHPNPFNPNTTISFRIFKESEISLAIYNVRGELIRNLKDGVFQPGSYSLQWNGLNDSHKRMPSGIYICRLDSERQSQTYKMVLLK